MVNRFEALDDRDFDDREFVLRMIDAMLERESLPDALRDRILELRRDVARMPPAPRRPTLA